jgi:hypothetical protein
VSESFIEPDSLNTIFQNLSAVVDDDGATKFLNSEISSFNFNGFIPLETDTIDVSELKAGMQFILIGDSTNSIRTALKIEFDDPEMTASPTNDYIISYLGPNGDIQTVTYDGSDQVEVYFEDWENKVLGSTGWTITQAGNAIFSNVAVRGRIEATEGFLENLGITGTLSVESGGSIEIGTDPGTPGNAGIVIDDTGLFAYDDDENLTLSIDAETGAITIGGTPGDDLATQDDLEGYIPEGGAAFDINTNVTTINGGQITTGSILADRINTNNLIVQNLESFSTSTASRIKILDINDQRHKLQFQTGWFREVTPAFIGATSYSNPNIGFGGSSIGIDINAGILNLGVTTLPSQIKLISRSFDSLGQERTITYASDFHWFYPLTNSANADYLVSGFSEIRLENTANPPSGTPLYSIRMDSINGFNVTGPVTFTGNVNGTFVGNGSGLTGVGSPIVISTSGPTNPSAYQDNTVWYVI